MVLNVKKENKSEVISLALEILSLATPSDSKLKKLSPTEIHILTEFLTLPDKYVYQRFSKYAKRFVINQLKDKYNLDYNAVYLNGIVYNLIKKQYLWRDVDDVIYIKESIVSYINNILSDEVLNIKFTYVST
jgi:hypothetical protein